MSVPSHAWFSCLQELLHEPTFLDTTAPTDEERITTFAGSADAVDDAASAAAEGEEKPAAASVDSGAAATKAAAAAPEQPVAAASNTFTTSENLEQFYTIVPGKVRPFDGLRAAIVLLVASYRTIFFPLIFSPSQLFFSLLPPPPPSFQLRLMALMAFLKGHCQGSDKGKAIVFCQSRKEAFFYQALISTAEKEKTKTKEQEDREKPLAEQLGPLQVFFLHGGMEQRDRTASYKGFCSATSGALVCTDVAARGLDLPAVSWILQMSAPPR